MTKQVIFLDSEGNVNAGIALDSGEIVCGCCGSIFEKDDYIILHAFEEWVDISEEICGDDTAALAYFENQVDSLSREDIKDIIQGKKTFRDTGIFG